MPRRSTVTFRRFTEPGEPTRCAVACSAAGCRRRPRCPRHARRARRSRRRGRAVPRVPRACHLSHSRERIRRRCVVHEHDRRSRASNSTIVVCARDLAACGAFAADRSPADTVDDGGQRVRDTPALGDGGIVAHGRWPSRRGKAGCPRSRAIVQCALGSLYRYCVLFDILIC